MEYMKPQSARLVDMSKVRSDTTAYKVRKAIYDFLQKGYPVNINDIANAIGVTRQAIYARPELRALIEYYGKYVQKSVPADSEEEYRMICSIPNLQELEKDIERLYNENRKLNLEYLRLQNELFALENGIEL